MICDECETVAHCMKNGCVPKTIKKDEAFDPQDYIDPETGEPFNPVEQLDLFDFIAGALGVSRGTAYDMIREALAEQPAPLLDLDSSTGFTFFDREKGSSFIGEVEMLKWLVENRSKDYWEHKAKEKNSD